MNMVQLAKGVENKIWEAIKEVSDPDSYEWEVTFKRGGKDILINNDTINK